ncbi:mannose-6-phosphate isomerase, class I [Bacillus mojavensis]|uniref:mannose-6-phosphate isomerase, class I n=1 Tax=Bacillus mojavensis TaxID=72360 RepID=UPI002DBEB5F1|nr:mannose-6-phosphate isomerase, class I [Bacillus mojavensis]MEC1290495.1 mannose-6-phosphate isomerase, class I [Bacillus mojavensis]MEC1702124.1 mannose-6-phosphate isomerase, class I [Bacillus mojavensis]MEC5246659.1 mannose-6-phosphate isomerase, class I [Bacillus mojavensis]
MKHPLFLEPIFKERIWGGTALRDRFGYSIPSEKTGECWAVSAHANGSSTIQNGRLSGKTLDQVWKECPEFFGFPQRSVFPLLVKVLDANMDLSVQVHPDDHYAMVYENGDLGKTECWYIIDCKEGAELILGHHAGTKEEFIQLIESGDWNGLLRRINIKPGDFFYVPSGTLHALCEGTLVLEIQQNSDTTYRVYDYERCNDYGQKRNLHIEKAMEVVNIPHADSEPIPAVKEMKDAVITSYVQSDYFTVYKWNVSGKPVFPSHQTYLLCSVVEGSGIIENNGVQYECKKGSHFILPAHFGEFSIEGTCELIISHP